MSIVWNFGPAAERARFNFKLKKKKREGGPMSSKPQASSAMKQTQLKGRIKT
tara:strand:+ start:171 stop:326 length:156 start_codon:yes stop_codon:yes gene_type:complete